jgi:hypothetical protein
VRYIISSRSIWASLTITWKKKRPAAVFVSMLLASGGEHPRLRYPAIRNKDARQGIGKQRNDISRLGRRAQDDRRTCSRFRQTMLDHKVRTSHSTLIGGRIESAIWVIKLARRAAPQACRFGVKHRRNHQLPKPKRRAVVKSRSKRPKRNKRPLLKVGLDKLGLLELGLLIVHNGRPVASREARDVPSNGATSSEEDSPLYPLTVSPIRRHAQSGA